MKYYFLLSLLLPLSLALLPQIARADTAQDTGRPAEKPVPVETQIAATLPAWTRPGKILLYVERGIPTHFSYSPACPPIDTTTLDLATPEGVAAANGRTTAWFGSIMSVAPAEMTVLNTDPALYDLPASRIAMAKPLEFLLKTLTPQQFGLLATTGLTMADLTQEQQLLFTAMIPDPLNLVSTDASPLDDAGYTKQIVNIPRYQILQQARLHAYLGEGFHIHDQIYLGDPVIVPYSDDILSGDAFLTRAYFSTGPMKYAGDLSLTQYAGGQEGKLLQNLLAEQVPTAPKKSDFNWKDRALNQPVNVDGINTVDDLVGRLSKVLNKELYADENYGHHIVMFGGDMTKPVSAVNLMRALAFSVSGAWRRVGPCYILTDDIAGLGQRKDAVRDIVCAWSHKLRPYGEITSKLASFNWTSTLSGFPSDPYVLPNDQLLRVLDNGTKDKATLKFGDLPTDVQTLYSKLYSVKDSLPADTGDNGGYVNPPLTPSTLVDFSVGIQTALELPGDGIMSLGGISGTLISPSKKPSKIALPENIQAVICAPKSTKEAVETVDKISEMGLNTLIIDVFCNGQTYFDSSTHAPKNKDAAGVLTAAIGEATKKHIMVYAAVDLLCWRKDYAQNKKSKSSTPIAEDVDINGTPSEIDGINRLKNDALNDQFANMPGMEGTVDEQINDGWVSPCDPAVRTILSSLMADLAKVQGISGIIMLDTAPPGYATDDPLIDPRSRLGFTVANRLKIIREDHIDPIDIDPRKFDDLFTEKDIDTGSSPSIYTNVMGFQSPRVNGFQTYLDSGDKETLKECVDSAEKTNPIIPILMADRRFGLTITPWDKTAPTTKTSAGPSTPQVQFSFLSMPILLMGQNDTPIADEAANFEEQVTTDYPNYDPAPNKPEAIAYNLVDGGVDENVPDMLDWLATYLALK